MEMEKRRMPIRREVSWSPGGLRKPLSATQNTQTPETECNAPWEKMEFNEEQMSRKANLTRSASLSEKELKEARIRSHIIAAQLTIPSNSSSRGVQLFNRRKKRVDAFTLQSCGEGSEEDRTEDVKINLPSVKLAWAERSSEGKDTGLNLKSSTTKQHSSQRGRVPLAGHNTEDPSKEYQKGKNMEKHAMRETHFLPVKEEQEEEDKPGDKIQEELEVKDEFTLGSNNADREAEINRNHMGSILPGKLLNGCNSTTQSERASHSTSKQTSTIINRTARPFLSPLTVQSPEALSPVMEIPPPPSYATPPLPAFTTPQPVAFSPPPPPPTHPLPIDATQPSETYYSNPPPVSPVTSPSSALPSELPASFLSQYPAMPNYGPPTAAKPSSFVPQPVAERKPIATIKTGILEEGATRRSNKKSMFTFKEKPVVSPNPELLALVQGVDERKKHGHKSVPEPASEEELLALGAEASNFLTKEEDKVEDASAPEWVSCLKSSRTRPRAEHRPEQTLINVSGKGAELFTKRQTRMEKYIVEKESGQIRSPSPTASLPPSWVYPSNMPGRVKAMVKSSDMNAQISQNLEAQQVVKQNPRQKAKAPEPIPEPTPLEYGSSKIERDLSGHRPYQLDSSLFILNPVKDPLSTLPRGAPKSKNMTSSPAFSRQASLPRNTSSHLSTRCASLQLPFNLIRGEAEGISDPASGPPRISSPMSVFSPEQVSSPRSRVQAPRPTFSAKKAGITPQTSKESSTVETPGETSRDMGTSMSYSSPESPTTGTWNPIHHPSTTISSCSFASPVSSHSGTRCQSPCSPPWGSRCQSPMVSQNNQSSSIPSISGFRASQTSKTTSSVRPPWGSRCHSPNVNQSTTVTSNHKSKQFQTSTTTSPCSPPWGSRCQSPMVNKNASPVISVSASRPTQTSTTTSPASPPWSSRSLSPALSQTGLSSPTTKPLYTSSITPSTPPPKDSRCMSPITNNLDSKANHRLLAKNIINAAKRKNSHSPGTLSTHSLPISPVGKSLHDFDCHKPPISPFQTRALEAHSPTFTSPPPTPTQRICSPVRLYNTRSLTDSDASIESEDSGHRSPGLHSYNMCPRGWGGSLRVKRSTISTDL